MSDNRQMGLQSNNSLQVASRFDLIEFLLTADTGTADVFLDTGNTGLFPSGIDVNGTVTNYWANQPYWTPAGDHNFSRVDLAVRNWFDLQVVKTLGKNFLFVCDCVFAADPGTEESFLDAGRNSTAGGWEIKITTSGQFAMGYREENGASLVSKVPIDLTARAGQRHVLALYIDVQSVVPQVMSRAWFAGGPSDVQQADLETPLPAVAPTQIINFFGRGGGGGTNHLAQFSSITRLNRARFYHLPAEDSSSMWALIAEEMWRFPGEHKLRATQT